MDDAHATPPEPRPHFYADLVDDPDALVAAHELDGIDAEIAFLRVRLTEYLRQHPGAYASLLRSIELIVRAVAARYRMSPQSTQQFAASVQGVLRQLGDELFPARVTDV